MLSLQRRTTRARKEASGVVGRRRAYSDFAYDYNSSDSEASAPDDDAEASLDDEEDSDDEDGSYRAPANKARRSATAAAARGTYMNGTGSDTSGTDFYLQQGQGGGNSGSAHKGNSSARVRKGRRDAKPSRVAANRRSAQRSRARKLQHVGELEKAVEQLHQELKASLPELSELREKQQAALQRNKKLKTQLRMAGVRVPDSPPPPTTDIKQEPDQEQRWQQQELKQEQQEEVPASPRPSPFQGDLLSAMHAAMYGAPKAKAAAAAPAAPASTAAAGKPPLASYGSNRSTVTTQASARGMRSSSSKSLHGGHVISPANGTSNGNKSPASDSAGTAAPIPVWRARAQRSSVRPRQAQQQQQQLLARAAAARNQQQAQLEGTQHAGTAFLQQRQQQQQAAPAMASAADDEDTHMAPAPSFSLPMVDSSRALSITMPRITTLPLTRSPTLDVAMEAASNPPTPSAGIAAFQAPHNAFARADTLEAALQAAFNLPPSSTGADAAMPLSRSATLEEAFIDAAAPSALGTGAAGPLAPGGLSEQTALAQVQQDIDAGLLDLGLASDPMVSEQLGSEVTAAAAAAADAVRSSGGDPVAAQLGALELAAPLLQEASGSVGSDHSSGLQWATSPQTLAGAPAMYGSSGYDGSSFSGRSLASGSSFGSGRSFNSGRSFGNGSSFGKTSGFAAGSSFAAGRTLGNGSSSFSGGSSFGNGSSFGSSFGSDASMRDVAMGSRGRMAHAGGLVTADSGPLLVDNVPMPGLDALDALLVS